LRLEGIDKQQKKSVILKILQNYNNNNVVQLCLDRQTTIRLRMMLDGTIHREMAFAITCSAFHVRSVVQLDQHFFFGKLFQRWIFLLAKKVCC
jgi:hypothetical protein